MVTSKLMLQGYGLRIDQLRSRPVNDNGLDINMLAVLSMVATLQRVMDRMKHYTLANPDDPRFTDLAHMISDGMEEVNALYE
jgi:hypothetical protein